MRDTRSAPSVGLSNRSTRVRASGLMRPAGTTMRSPSGVLSSVASSSRMRSSATGSSQRPSRLNRA